MFAEWGEVDHSHRKLAHRGSYLVRVWVSPASVRRVLERQGLRSVPAEYANHYNLHRPHRAVGQASPLRPGVPVVVAPPARIVRRDRLGG